VTPKYSTVCIMTPAVRFQHIQLRTLKYSDKALDFCYAVCTYEIPLFVCAYKRPYPISRFRLYSSELIGILF